MDDPIRLLLTNAAAAGLIALVAWAASRTVRRQAVVHGLWLLALARLVMPPIAPLPLVPAWPGLALGSRLTSPIVVPIPPATGLATPVERPSRVLPAVGQGTAALVTPAPIADHWIARARPSRVAAAHPVVRVPSNGTAFRWRAAAWLSLGAGALAIVILTGWRFARFSRLLDCAVPASNAVAQRASRLAERMGLSRVPPVLLVPARIPPMLWPHRGGPRLLLPAGLLPDLLGDELDALLAHELAHVRRRDHWVRLVEIAATALFWWYPVTWWARTALRRAEERCCDEWVLRVLPRSAEAYAKGLLKCLTFVTHRTGALPSLASGAGPVEDIEARLKEILMTRPVPRLAAPARLTLAAAAALGLAVFPTNAQSSATKDEPAATAAVVATPATATTPASPATPATAPRPAARPATAARPRAAAPAVLGGVEGGIVGGVPGGVSEGAVEGAGVTAPPALAPRPGLPPLAGLTPREAVAPMAAPGPTPQAQPAPAPAIATRTPASDPARRALEDQRRAIENERRQLQQKELDLQGRQLDLEAQEEQAELRANADRLRAEGHADEAARVEKQAKLDEQRVELQKRQLGVEKERALLEAKVEAEEAAQQARIEALEQAGKEAEVEEIQRAMERLDAERQQAEQVLEKKQQAIQTEIEQAEKQMQEIAVEEQVLEMRHSSDDLVRSLTEQIQSLKVAVAEAPSQKAAADREIQRLEAAIHALESGATPRTAPSKTPRTQP
jgi:beta-lactamase regulating signal transducer with metallopeptidase domain